MEAVPRLPMLNFELKVSPESPEFGPKLKQYIQQFYHEDPESYRSEISELESLRATAVRPSRDFNGCSTVKKYYCQLHFLQSRFPMGDDGAAAVSFSWYDIYSGGMYTISDIKYEMACILYNIGALHTELGAAETRQTEEGMKVSCTHFQCAAWAFQHLRDSIPNAKGSDFSPPILVFLNSISLAQAQECILEKSIVDNRKATIIAKLSAQLVDYYKACSKALDPTKGSDETDVTDIIGSKLTKKWHRLVDFKIQYYGCVSYLYQGQQVEEQQKMGERVAYYQAAMDKLNEAIKIAKNMDKEAVQETISFTRDVVGGKLNAATKENEFVYHEKIPGKETLIEIKGASLVKGIPIDHRDVEISGQDIFHRLVPMEAHEASSLYSEEKAKILRQVGMSVDEKDGELNLFLAAIKFDQLQVHSEPDMMPDELVECCAAMNARPNAVPDLIKAMSKLSSVYHDVDAEIQEVRELLEEEEKKEQEYQTVLGVKRPPSNVVTQLAREAGKYQEVHTKASESNQALHKVVTLNVSNLRMLSTSLKELQKQMPPLKHIIDDPKTKELVKELDHLRSKIEEMQQQRGMLDSQLREALRQDDITKKLASQKDRPIEDVFAEELKKHERCVTLIQQNLTAQENILSAVTDANARYGEVRMAINDILSKRIVFVKTLTGSYAAYQDVLDKCGKGIEFFEKLETNVNKLLHRVKGVCKVQEEEREEVMQKSAKKKETKSDIDMPPVDTSSASTTPKLKDYLQYMKGSSGTTAAYYAANNSNITPSASVPSNTYNPAPQQAYNDVPTPQASGPNYASNPYAYPQTYSAAQTYPGTSASYPGTTVYNSLSTAATSATAYQYPGYRTQAPVVAAVPMPHVTTPPNLQSNPQPESTAVSSYNVPSFQPQLNTMQQYPANNNSGIMPVAQNNTAAINAHNLHTTSQHSSYPQSVPSMPPYQMVPGSNTSYRYSSTPSPVPQPNSVPAVSVAYPFTSTPSHLPQHESVAVNNATYPYSMPVPQSNSNASSTATYPCSNVRGNHNPNSAIDPYSGASSTVESSGAYPYSGAPTTVTNSVAYPYSGVPTTATADTYPYNNMPQQQANIAYPQTIATASPVQYGEYGSTNVSQYYTNNPYMCTTNSAVPSINSATDVTNYYTNYLKSTSTVQQPKTSTNIPPEVTAATSYAHPSTAVPPPQNTTGNTHSQSPAPTTAAYQQQHGYGQYTPYIPYSTQANYPTSSTYYSLPIAVTSGSSSMSQTVTSPTLNPSYPYSSSNPVSTANQTTYTNANTAYQYGGPMYQTPGYTHQYPGYSTQPTSAENYYYPGYSSSVANPDQSTFTMPVSSTYSQAQMPPKVKKSSNLDLLAEIDDSVVSQTVPLVPQLKTNHVNILSEPSVVKEEKKRTDLLSDATIAVKKVEDILILQPKVLTADEIRKQKEEEAVMLEASKTTSKELFSDMDALTKFAPEVENLAKFVESLCKKSLNGPTPLDLRWKELMDLQEKDSQRLSISVARCYPMKNRFPDILPYDHSRVELPSTKDDYINASHVRHPSLRPPIHPHYIIAQAPLPSTQADFWCMTWEQQVEIVVCLLADSELKDIYWPTDRYKDLRIGPLNISVQSSNNKQVWVERILSLTHLETKTSRVVIHLQFSQWPGSSFPTSPAPFLSFVSEVIAFHHQQRSLVHPVLVHCLSGVGRSGLFCLVLAALNEINCGHGFIDLVRVGAEVSHQRKNILRDREHLKFCYQAVLYYTQDLLLKRGILSTRSSFEEKPKSSAAHTRHPSEDFLLTSNTDFSKLQSKVGLSDSSDGSVQVAVVNGSEEEKEDLGIGLSPASSTLSIGSSSGIKDGIPSRRKAATSQSQLVAGLCGMVYRALDFGYKDEEERPLSPELTRLIDCMSSVVERPETDDEGIERDSCDSDDDQGSTNSKFNLDRVLEMCASHVCGGASSVCGTKGSSADTHYKAVCHALVAEALELADFLAKVATGEMQRQREEPSPDLEKLHVNDWARLWVQVIRELRRGVQLKKVSDEEQRCPPIEFTLTPYEILMDDIRSKRYKLNKVMVDGDIPPRVKKDAHAIILDFIRSRPPLKKVSERQLAPPPRKKSNPIELLLESIRQEHHLKPVPASRPTSADGHHSESSESVGPSNTNSESHVTNGTSAGEEPTRRLIKADFSLLDSLDDDFDDDDDDFDIPSGGSISPELIIDSRADGLKSTPGSTPSSPWHRPALDLATQCSRSAGSSPAHNLSRRHTITLPSPSQDGSPNGTAHRRHGSFRSKKGVSNGAASFDDATDSSLLPPTSCSHSSLQEEFFRSNHWQQAVECLSLTLEEVVHIRNVLTKADLESLPVDCSLKDDVEKSKVCFLCLKTRFSIFGPWGHKCRMCRRTVCNKCCSKMRIPTDHFSQIPVFTLSPTLSPREEDQHSFAKTILAKLTLPESHSSNSVGSAPASPKSQRSDDGQTTSAGGAGSSTTTEVPPLSEEEDTGESPHSLPSLSSVSMGILRLKKSRLSRTTSVKSEDPKKAERLKGSLMTVCHDCKTMVLQIIRSSRAKRSTVLRQMTLNLDPVY